MDKDQKHAAAWEVTEKVLALAQTRTAMGMRISKLLSEGVYLRVYADGHNWVLSEDLSAAIVPQVIAHLHQEIDRLGEELESLLAFHSSEAGEH